MQLYLIGCLFILIADSVFARCPNWCNQRGVCSSPHEGGNCICDHGFTGEDCSQRLCPASFDPIDLDEKVNRRAVRLETGSMSGVLSGRVEFSFAGSSVLFDANANTFGSADCKTLFTNKLKSVEDLSCERELSNPLTNSGTYLITLNSYPLAPYMNNLIFHNGNPGRNLFGCNMSLVDEEDAIGPYCRISDAEPLDNFPLYSECSNHGNCNRIYGNCTCERGFKGPSCNDIRDSDDIVKHHHDGPFFTGSLLKLNVKRDSSPSFNIFSAQLDSQNVTVLSGDKKLTHSGDVVVHGSIQVGISASETLPTSNFHSIVSDNSRAHFTAFHSDQLVFGVDAFGNTLTVGSFTADNSTFVVNRGTAHGHNMKLANNLEVSGSVNVEDSLTIGSGFVLTPGGMTVDVERHSGTLFELRSRQEGFNGSLLEIHTLGEKSSLIKTVSNGLTTFELSSSGLVKMQGLRLTSGGVFVESGGVQVEHGGLLVKGGLTVESGAINLDNADLQVGRVSATSKETNLKEPVLSAHVESKRYVGTLVELSSVAQDGDSNKFNFVSVKNGDASVLNVASDGTIESAGGAVLNGPSGLTVKGSTNLLGNVMLSQSTVKPVSVSNQWVVNIPLEATYVLIEPVTSHDTFVVEIKFDSKLDVLQLEGRVVIITNNGAKTTKGVAAIPTQSTVMLVFNGKEWVDVEALKAPMHVLKEVTTFEAAADLHIGNHSLSAFSLSATALEKGRVIFGGSNGLLIDNDKFTYVKGVLTAPSLKIEKLAGAVDARGNEISNAVLLNPKLDTAIIKATEISISDQVGLAYFTKKGSLLGSPSLTLTPEGHLMITELNSNVKVKGHTLSDVVIDNGKLDHIQSADIAELRLTGENHERGSILMLDNNNEVISVKSILSANDDGDVSIHSLKVDQLMGDLNVNHHALTNVKIESGSSVKVQDIKTRQLSVDDLKAPAGSTRIVFADSNGKLQTSSDVDSLVKIPNLSVENLQFSRNKQEVDFAGNVLKNVKFDANTVDFGLQNNFEVNSLKVHELSRQESVGRFLSANADGKIENLKGVSMKGDHLDIGEGSLLTSGVKTHSLQVTDLKSSVLGTNNEGKVISLKGLDMDNINILRDLTVFDGGYLSLQSIRSTLLATDANGKIIGLNSAEGSATPINVKSIHSDLIVSAVSKGSKAEYETIYITSKNEEGKPLKSDTQGNILVKQADGMVASYSKGHLDSATGSLHINSVQPVTPQDTLHISHALVVESNVSFSAIHASPSISTQTLSVSGVSDFNDDVAVDGTLTVHGNVIGSGPYVDSSDIRFKKDIKPLGNALDTVMKLNAVNYVFKTEEFPDRDFPATQQIGYIADDVLPVVPELVTKDKDGYLGISYAKAAVIAAEAVKEHKIQSDAEIAKLREEVNNLKELVRELLKRSDSDKLVTENG